MTDSCLNSFDAAPVPEKKEAWRTVGNKNPRVLVEARQQRLYKRQLEGLPARQLVLDHASKEGVSVATG